MSEAVLSEAQLRQELQEAMKRREMPTVYVLRGLLAAVANRRIDSGGVELPASEILALVQREAKKHGAEEIYDPDTGVRRARRGSKLGRERAAKPTIGFVIREATRGAKSAGEQG